MKIQVWVPEYTSAVGGIQTFSRFLIRALRDNYPNARITVVSKNDTSYPEPETDPTDHFVPLGWWPGYLRTAAFSEELVRLALRDRPDLIVTTHVNFTPVAHWLQKVIKSRYAAIGHGIEVWSIENVRIRRALQVADRLCAVSEFTRARMAEALGIDQNRIAVLPNTFDPEQFTPDRKPHFLLKRYGLQPNQPVILTIARLAGAERYKGYDQVIAALPRVRERFPNVRYVLGGRGRDRPRIEALIQKLGVTENVILAGYVPDHEMKSHYNLCDVFAMPSKGEGFGIVFLEALACGKPVLAGNKDGSVDAVVHGELGLLIDPDSVAQISDGLLALLGKTAKPAELFEPEALRARVVEAYGYERFKQRVREVLPAEMRK